MSEKIEFNWIPIDQAPKNEWIVALRPSANIGRWDRVVIVRWSDAYGAFIWCDHFDIYSDDIDEKNERGRYVFDPFSSNEFTHWIPLPKNLEVTQ